MRSTLALLAAGLLAACASSGSGGFNGGGTTDRQTTTVTYSSATGAPININLETASRLETRSFPVEGTPQEVWRALALAYADLGIPLAAYDSTQLYLGNPGLALNRRLGRERISRYLNCGVDPLGSSFADRYSVRLNVVSRVRATAAGTLLETQVTGEAAERGVAADAVRCASTGGLEEAIANATKLRLAGTYPRR